MPAQLSDLLKTPTKEELLDQQLDRAKGIGSTSQTGFSPGSVTATGAPTAAASVRVEVTSAGNLGSAQTRVSFDGGATWTLPASIPSDGLVDYPDLSITLVYTDDPAAQGDSFLQGDVFSFELNVSQLAVTAWQPTSVPLTLMEIDSACLADLHTAVGNIAAGGLLEYSTGPWLTILARNAFSIDRSAGRSTVGQVVLTDASSEGPFTIGDAQLTVMSDDGKLYRNSGAFTLAQGGTATITVVAVETGADYNVGNNTIHTLVTTLPGVTVNNPSVAGGPWYQTTGVDPASDASVVQQCRDRWPALGIGAPAPGYDLWARTATPAVTRTRVRVSPTVPGQVDVVIAGPNGTATDDDVTAVDSYIQPRVALGSTAVVSKAVEHPYTVTADVYIPAARFDEVSAKAIDQLNAYNSSIPLGGNEGAVVYYLKIAGALDPKDANGVGLTDHVELTSPAMDITLADLEVAKMTIAVTFHSV